MLTFCAKFSVSDGINGKPSSASSLSSTGSDASGQGNTRIALNNFFLSVQSKALKQAEFAIGNRDEALDILQDAMMRLAQSYSGKGEQWPQLFQRILQNLIRDWHRKNKVRRILLWWNQLGEDNNSLEEAIANEEKALDLPGAQQYSPEKINSNKQIATKVSGVVKELPLRQQQAFLLRAWHGHDTQETAFAMGCSEGSVKTHYSRAVHRLREALGDIDL
ncbi:MAG: RNA polymerase sigma-70 factor (ECF subfamily) [Lentisphaeria bacterium]